MEILSCIVLLSAFMSVLDASPAGHEVNLENPTDWGLWGEMDRCPEGSYARRARVKMDPYHGPALWEDDAAVSGIELECVTKDGVPTKTVTSSVNDYGTWLDWYDCKDGFINAARLRGESAQGSMPDQDDVAVTNLGIKCSNGKEHSWKEAPMAQWGKWMSWGGCTSKMQAICGIKTKIDHQGYDDSGKGYDDSGLNDVAILCCYVD